MPKMKTLLGYIAFAMVVWWVITNPAQAATVVKHVSVFITTAATGIGQFMGAL